MKYELNYCISSIIFLSITAFFYFKQKHISNKRTQVYTNLLILVLFTLLTEYIATVVDPYAKPIPIWLLYLLNILMLSGTQLITVFFTVYVMVITGIYLHLSKAVRALLLLPYLVSLITVISSVFTNEAIFYIDAEHVYNKGPLHQILYAEAAIYVILIIIIILTHSKQVSKDERLALYYIVITSIIAMVLQSLFPLYLLNTTACALSLFLMYYTLQSPYENLDPMTGILNKNALWEIVNGYYEQKLPFVLTMVQLNSFRFINHTFGMNTGDKLHLQLSAYLTAIFHNGDAIRYSGDSYAVIEKRAKLDIVRLSSIAQAIPEIWIVDKIEVPLSYRLYGFNSTDYENTKDFMYSLALINSRNREINDRMQIINRSFLGNLFDEKNIEKALRKAVSEDLLQVYYQPITDAEGRVVALEALSRIFDDEFGSISPDKFIRCAEKNGLILQLGDQILEKICAFISSFDLSTHGVKHISMNLSIVQLMQEDFVSHISSVLNSCNIGPEQICFEITETEQVVSQPSVIKNIYALHQAGYKMILDDFGSGYANFNYISFLPVSCIKIDKSLLWDAMKDEKQMILLLGIVETINKLGLESVCEGVETEEQLQTLHAMNVQYYQGFYYSRALETTQLKAYLTENHGGLR